MITTNISQDSDSVALKCGHLSQFPENVCFSKQQFNSCLVGLSDNNTNLTGSYYVEVQSVPTLDKAKVLIKGKPLSPMRNGSKSGKRVLQYKPGYRALPRIHNAIEYLCRNQCSMVVLTFGKVYPTDKEARDLFAIFRKRVNRYLKNRKFRYLWVIEVQQRGAPHFHIITPDYICKDWLNNAWTEIVSEWLTKQGKQPEIMYPYVNGIRDFLKSKNYVTKGNTQKVLYKYLTKGNDIRPIEGKIYGMDTATSNAIKEVKTIICFDSESEANDFVINVFHRYQENGKQLRVYYDREANTKLYLDSLHTLRKVIKDSTVLLDSRKWLRKHVTAPQGLKER